MNRYMYYLTLVLIISLNFPGVAASLTAVLVAAGIVSVLILRPKVEIDKSFVIATIIFLCSLLLSSLLSDYVLLGVNKTFSYIRHMVLLLFPIAFIKQRKEFDIMLWALIVCFIIFDIFVIIDWLLGAPRAVGPNMEIMVTASFLVMQISVLLIISFGRFVLPLRMQSSARVAFILSVLALIGNNTRGAWLAALVMLFLYSITSFLYHKEKKYLLIIALSFLVAIGMYYFSPNFAQRLESIIDAKHLSNTERVLIWESAVQMFKDHPVAGIGLGTFGKHYNEQYISPEAKEDGLAHAHNTLLHLAAETGILGALSFIYLFYTLLRISCTNFCIARDNFMAQAIFFMLIGFLVQGLTEVNYDRGLNMRLFWFLIGMSFAMNNIYAGHIYVENNKRNTYKGKNF